MKYWKTLMVVCFLVLCNGGCAGRTKTVLLDRDVIKVFSATDWSKEQHVGKYKYSAPDYMLLFTNENGYVISSFVEDFQTSYEVNLISNKLILKPYHFAKGNKIKSQVDFSVAVKEVYDWKEIVSHFEPHEYVISGARINGSLVAMNMVTKNGVDIDPGTEGFIALYDGKNLIRKHLMINQETILISEVDGSGMEKIYYDEKHDSVFFVGFLSKSPGMFVFQYKVKEDRVKIQYTSMKAQIKNVWVIPGTDYLIFWNDGLVLKRID